MKRSTEVLRIARLKRQKTVYSSAVGTAVSILLLGSGAISSARAVDQLTPVATGLNNPRGLAFGPNGSLYAAEAGLGAGDGSSGAAAGIGLTGSITEIKHLDGAHPDVSRIVTGLASSGPNVNSIVGPDGVSVQGNGGIYVIMAESTAGMLAEDPDADPRALAQFGRLLKVTPAGTWKVTANVGDFNYQ